MASTTSPDLQKLVRALLEKFLPLHLDCIIRCIHAVVVTSENGEEVQRYLSSDDIREQICNIWRETLGGSSGSSTGPSHSHPTDDHVLSSTAREFPTRFNVNSSNTDASAFAPVGAPPTTTSEPFYASTSALAAPQPFHPPWAVLPTNPVNLSFDTNFDLHIPASIPIGNDPFPQTDTHAEPLQSGSMAASTFNAYTSLTVPLPSTYVAPHFPPSTQVQPLQSESGTSAPVATDWHQVRYHHQQLLQKAATQARATPHESPFQVPSQSSVPISSMVRLNSRSTLPQGQTDERERQIYATATPSTFLAAGPAATRKLVQTQQRGNRSGTSTPQSDAQTSRVPRRKRKLLVEQHVMEGTAGELAAKPSTKKPRTNNSKGKEKEDAGDNGLSTGASNPYDYSGLNEGGGVQDNV